MPRDWAQAMAGAGVTIGARSAAWAPVRDLAVIVVIDEHDEGLQGGARARRGMHATSRSSVDVEPACRSCSSRRARASRRSRGGRWSPPVATQSAKGWPALEVVDMRKARDPVRTGLYSDALVRLFAFATLAWCACSTARAGLDCSPARRVVSSPTCERCGAAVVQPTAELECPRCGTVRPPVCLRCHSTRFKNLRAGVTRVREELEALAGEAVVDVTADARRRAAPALVSTSGPRRRCTASTRPTRSRSSTSTRSCWRRATARPRRRSPCWLARLPGWSVAAAPGSRVLVQTRVPEPRGDRCGAPRRSRLGSPPRRRSAAPTCGSRRSPRWPRSPVRARPSSIAALGSPLGVEVMGPAKGTWLVRAAIARRAGRRARAHASSDRRACASRSTRCGC